jgi:hypothetical protein
MLLLLEFSFPDQYKVATCSKHLDVYRPMMLPSDVYVLHCDAVLALIHQRKMLLLTVKSALCDPFLSLLGEKTMALRNA